jgi:photosystem II stability/assembly factor-like uncharacterized protein
VTPETLRVGTTVRQRELGKRVFVDSRHGVALDGAGQATYAVATTNGGRTWRTSSPALVVHAAQGPLEVGEIGAVSARLYFAYGAEAADVTADGGKHWYRTVFPGGVVSVFVFSGLTQLELAAVVESNETSPTSNWVYVTTDAGMYWSYDEHM